MTGYVNSHDRVPGWPVCGIEWHELPEDLPTLMALSLDESDPDRATAAAVKHREREKTLREVPRIEAALATLPPPPTLAIVDAAPDPRTNPAFEPWPEGMPLARTFPEPEDRGRATLSPLGEVEYVVDLVRPGRIVVAGAEEGSGKSYAIDTELGIRVAVAGGSFAGTWPVLVAGPVLILSEMHPDDDYEREATVLDALGLERSALEGRYYRLPLMTAAGGHPALMVPAWRDYITGWLRDREAKLLIIDTATGATQVEPWGKAIQAVYQSLRAMTEAYPALAIVLLIHLKKPAGRGARRLTDVLGEWGRWNDVTLLLEADGTERTKLSTHKRIRHPRRIVATKRDGLLVEPQDAGSGGTKVPSADVLAAIAASPGVTYAGLATVLGVSKPTAKGYAQALGDQIRTEKGTAKSGPEAAYRLYPIGKSESIAKHARLSDDLAMSLAMESSSSEIGKSPYIKATSFPMRYDDSPSGPDDDPEGAGDDDEPPADWLA